MVERERERGYSEGWYSKASALAKLDDALDILTAEEREQVDWIIAHPQEPYHTVKGMIERRLVEGRAKISAGRAPDDRGTDRRSR